MNEENEILLANAIIEDSVTANCGHRIECTEVCGDCNRCQNCCTCRVTQTIDRLISNLPEAVIKLKGLGLTSLARQIQNDLENLVYWQKTGGLTKGHYRLISGASALSDDAKRAMPIYVKREADE